MIKCDKGNTIIHGTAINLLAELSTLTHNMHDQFIEAGIEKEEAEDMLRKSVENGFMTREELDEAASKKIKEELLEPKDALDRLLELMEKAFLREDKNGRNKD